MRYEYLSTMKKIDTYPDLNVFESAKKERIYIGSKNRELENDILNEYVKELNDFILQDGYPCIGAQAAANGKSLSVGIFKKMNDGDTPKELAYGLLEYLIGLKNSPSNYLTYVAVFPFDSFDSEEAFENGIWRLITELHELDREHFDWSPKVGSDPSKKNFSFSFGGKGFFLVGMHPGSSRKARRFKYPTIAFNLHEQFENLRKKGRYEVMKKATRNNELQFDGSINPMLNDFGKGLEAPQYSGRHVAKDWKCPFSIKDGN